MVALAMAFKKSLLDVVPTQAEIAEAKRILESATDGEEDAEHHGVDCVFGEV